MDQLSLTFQALSDPTRRAMLKRLSKGPSAVSELARPFDLSAPAISKHLKVLEKAKLITRTKDAQWRPCTLNVAPLKEANHWVEQYRQFWEERFDRLEDYLNSLNSKKEKNTKQRKKRGKQSQSK